MLSLVGRRCLAAVGGTRERLPVRRGFLKLCSAEDLCKEKHETSDKSF